jgi:hypothetical protein
MNRAALFAAVSDWSARNDLTPGLLSSFLTMAEARIFLGSPEVEPIRHYRMLTTATLTPSAGLAPIPADFLDAERATLVEGGTTVEIEYRPPARLALNETRSGPARYFGLRGQSLIFAPPPAGDVTLLYYARPATPVADADENWIMQLAPAVYLSAMLIEVGEWLRDESMVAEQKTKYLATAGALQRSGDRTQTGGMTALRITAR